MPASHASLRKAASSWHRKARKPQSSLRAAASRVVIQPCLSQPQNRHCERPKGVWQSGRKQSVKQRCVLDCFTAFAMTMTIGLSRNDGWSRASAPAFPPRFALRFVPAGNETMGGSCIIRPAFPYLKIMACRGSGAGCEVPMRGLLDVEIISFFVPALAGF